ncbi:membrane-spanning 4-domains subfamily A member 4A-like isoform X2 [Neovison vison]|uniref:Membrane-spanning 4-domains subfamily A member 4A n=1 Tax=Neovison vison TaxID=452646 RepID=A0A8C7BXV5_NEOVI|nr:membrane-spanning 4-domains subfamily A member 4A-like isoform X2 [Neogale vison]
MATTQGLEGTTGAGPDVHQPEKSAVLYPHQWKWMSEKFLKGEPKVLGVVQILIALMNLSLGIININVMFPFNEYHYLLEHEVYKIVGSLMFIVSGSLSIVAGIKTTKGLIRSSLGLNISSSVLAAFGTYFTASHLNSFRYNLFHCSTFEKTENCFMSLYIFMGLDAMVILLSMLEFCVSVSLSAFGCKVTCCHPEGVMLIMPSNPHTAEIAFPEPFSGGLMPPTDQQQNVPENAS